MVHHDMTAVFLYRSIGNRNIDGLYPIIDGSG